MTPAEVAKKYFENYGTRRKRHGNSPGTQNANARLSLDKANLGPHSAEGAAASALVTEAEHRRVSLSDRVPIGQYEPPGDTSNNSAPLVIATIHDDEEYDADIVCTSGSGIGILKSPLIHEHTISAADLRNLDPGGKAMSLLPEQLKSVHAHESLGPKQFDKRMHASHLMVDRRHASLDVARVYGGGPGWGHAAQGNMTTSELEAKLQVLQGRRASLEGYERRNKHIQDALRLSRGPRKGGMLSGNTSELSYLEESLSSETTYSGRNSSEYSMHILGASNLRQLRPVVSCIERSSEHLRSRSHAESPTGGLRSVSPRTTKSSLDAKDQVDLKPKEERAEMVNTFLPGPVVRAVIVVIVILVVFLVEGFI